MDNVQFVFGRNRAEEFPRDVWNRFVVPFFYERLQFHQQTKALVIVGGRGCGKTTLLNYFSHPTQFSPERSEHLNKEDLRYIGLYYRADTNFLSGLQGDSHTHHEFLAAFQHSLAYNIAMEMVASLESINQTGPRQTRFGRLDTLDFSKLGKPFGYDFGKSLADFKRDLKALKSQLASWLNNPERIEKPVFLPPEVFLEVLIDFLKDSLDYLKDSSFAVFIDEYENLLEYQQRFINGLLKHGKYPLLYNIAMKRNGFSTRKTSGPESLQDIHDYHQVDIEELLEEDFNLFASELLLFKLLEQKPSLSDELPIDPAVLRSSELTAITNRRREDYRKEVLAAAAKVLPRLTEREIAAQAIADSRIRGKLLENIKRGLNTWHSKLDPTEFVRPSVPGASIVTSALLNRGKEHPDMVLQELKALEAGRNNRFTSSADWIHNNLFGVVLQLYAASNAPCPLYAGFDTFTTISKGNIRHFLELCRRAFDSVDFSRQSGIPQVDVEEQADVVRNTAYAFLGEVRGAGQHGNQLYGMALTMGAVFRQKQRALEQSEPEINHFTISIGQVDEQLANYLSEAVKWSVLYQEPETKMKGTGSRNDEYILNPIFAGHFHISYRKRRSTTFSTDELTVMFEGKLQDRDKLVRSRGGSDEENNNLTLDFGGTGG
jgi:hypothetical protein